MRLPHRLFSSSARQRFVPWLAAWVALLMAGGCAMTHPSPRVPRPPALVSPAGPEDEPASVHASAPAEAAPAQHLSVQALLARSDVGVRLISAGRAADLWPWAAPFLQATGQRDRILADIARVRAALGPVQSRTRAGAMGVRAVSVGPESRMPPPGQYAEVEYAVQLANGDRAVERLSFRLESDGWRFAGYAAQVLPPDPPAPPTAGR